MLTLLLSAAAFGQSSAQELPPACSPASQALTVSTANELAALVQRTNCSQGEFVVSWEGELTFSEPIVVGNSTAVLISGVGTGAVLDGGGSSRLFQVSGGAALHLENLELRNGSAPEFSLGGGAIYADGDELTLLATSCNFTSNSSPVDGGAISSRGAVSMEFIDCRFEDNSAEQHGGAVMADSALAVIASNSLFVGNVANGSSFEGKGGAIYLSGGTPELSLHTCELRSNRASFNGGAVYSNASGSITVNATWLEANWAGYWGGGICVTGEMAQVDVLDSLFTDNFVNDIVNWDRYWLNLHGGGAVYVFGPAGIALKSSNFSGNGAESGGAAMFYGNNNITVEGSLFAENLANNNGGGVSVLNGGGFDAIFTDTVFLENWSGGNGGGLYSLGSTGSVNLTRTNFSNNAAAYRDGFPNNPGSYRGGGYWTSGDAGMESRAVACLFEGNEADAQGGAVAIDGGTFNATACNFSGNVGGSGGAIAASRDYEGQSAATVAVRGGFLSRNTAEVWYGYQGSYGYGGALFAEEGAEATLDVVTLDGNLGGLGGAVSVSAGSLVSASGADFSANVAEICGGAVQAWGNGSRFVSEGCTFAGNAAEGSVRSTTSTSSTSSRSSFVTPNLDDAGPAGGAICVYDGGSVFVLNSTLSDNAADGRGGGLYCGSKANVTVASARFDGQTSGQGGSIEAHGGACAAVDGCSVHLEDSSFSGNSALDSCGGAVGAESGSEVIATGCLFSGNQANGGGAVCGMGEETRVTVLSGLLTDNAAVKDGGGLKAFALGYLRTESSRIDGNHAGELGGGIHCIECTMWVINSTFQSNKADGSGGGMRLSSASTVTIDLCHFIDNQADYDGGALAVDTATDLDGGTEGMSASYSYSSYVGSIGTEELSSSTQVVNVTAEEDMADLLCLNTSFTGNVAGERGGTLYSNTDATIEMQDCNSTSNTATLGGSIYMSRSELQLRKCVFSGDTVPTGSIVYTLGAKVRARECVFEDTTGNSGMLAVQAGSTTEFEAQDCCFVGWMGSDVILAEEEGVLKLDGCDFSGSKASCLVNMQDGGKLAVVRNARLGTSNYQANNYGADFEARNASVNASVSLFGVNIAGCELSGCTSVEKCSEGDLGVYCHCYVSVVDSTSRCLGQAGRLTLTGPDSVVSTTYPDAPQTSFVLSWNDTEAGTEIFYNLGEGVGGPGLWEVVWTNDPNSVVWEVMPSTGLAYHGENITISVAGEVATYWNGQSSTVITAEAPYQEEVDSSSTTINVTFVYCTQGEYWDGSKNSCKMCSDVQVNPQGLNCDSEGTLLETLPLAEGFWRSVETSTTIRECFNDDACVGSSSSQHILSPDDYCGTGYLGPYCAVCMDGYTTGVLHTCHSCNGTYWAGMVVVVALTGVVLVAGVVIVFNDLVGNPALTDLSETRFSVISRMLRTIPFQKLKIPFVVLQIMTQYASITSIEFPAVFQTFLSTISVINLELGWVFTSVCIVDVNFYGNLLAATIGPLLFLLVLFVTYLYTCKKHGLEPRSRELHDQTSFPISSYRTSSLSSSEDDTAEPEQSVMSRVQDKYATVALTLAFLLYSTVSTVIFQTFSCDELEDIGKRYLRADYAIDCDSGKHQAFQLYAGLMILVYPVGIPIVFAVVLWRKRNIINPPKDILSAGALNSSHSAVPQGEGERYGRPCSPDPRLTDRRIAQTVFLWRAYRPGAYYFEVLECFRRLLLTGCLVFVLPDSAGQAAVACVLAVLTVAVFALVNPYTDADDHRAYTLGALAIFLTMFMGLVVRVDLADEETQSQRVLGVLLILLTVGLLVLAVAECLWEERRLTRGSQGADDGDGHIFLRRRRGDRKRKEGRKGRGGAGKSSEMEDKFRTSGSLYAPKLEDVPIDRGVQVSKNSCTSVEMVEVEKSAATASAAAGATAAASITAGGARPRGAQMFMLSSAGQDNRAHVAFAGTSSNRHPSANTGGGVGAFNPTHRGSESGGISGDAELGHSSTHRRLFGHDHARRDYGGGCSGLVPAEAESAPRGMEMEPAPPSMEEGGGDGGGGGGLGRRKRNKKRSKSRRDGGRSLAWRNAGDGGMRPAVPDAGPLTDEMRPSPGDGTGGPSPWIS